MAKRLYREGFDPDFGWIDSGDPNDFGEYPQPPEERVKGKSLDDEELARRKRAVHVENITLTLEEWHSGQWSAFYSLLSTGLKGASRETLDQAEIDAEKAMRDARRMFEQGSDDLDYELARLKYLLSALKDELSSRGPAPEEPEESA